MSDVDRAGHCPICSNPMVEMGNLVVCPTGHYKASFDEWDRIWFAFDVAVDDSDDLIKNLLALNEVEVNMAEVEKMQEAAIWGEGD